MIRTRFLALRDRLLTSVEFRRKSQKIPLVQSLANRQAADLLHIFSGFIHSQVVLACVRLGLFERLRDGPLPAATLARDLDLPLERARHLFDAAAALKLLDARAPDTFGLGMLGATLVDNQPLTAMVRHHALLYEDLADPVALFRSAGSATRLAKLWPYASGDSPGELTASDVSNYTTLMAASQAMVAEQVLDAYSLRRCRTLLDLGGGAGAFVKAAAERWPALELRLVDLPAVAEIAVREIEDCGLSQRVEVLGVDATAEPLPGNNDVISLIRILHDHDDERALGFLQAARAALAPGGVLLVAEPLAGKRGPGPLIDAYFSIYLLAMGSGRPRTFAELAELVRRAGFRRVRRRRTRVPLITSVIVATA